MTITDSRYAPRRTTSVGVWSDDSWRLKAYWMTVDGAPPDEAVLEAARQASLDTLSDKEGYGAGFVVVHRGEMADWIVLCWWTDSDIMRRRVLTHADDLVSDRSDEDFLGCVWELSVIDWERKAWINTILRHPDSGTIDDYIAAVYPSEYC